MIGIILSTLVIFLFIYNWYGKARIPEKFPTGPLGLPLIGYTPFLKRNFFGVIEELHMKYGGIFSVNIGPKKRTVVIGDYEILKDIFKHDELTYRPPSPHNAVFRHGDKAKGDSRGLISR